MIYFHTYKVDILLLCCCFCYCCYYCCKYIIATKKYATSALGTMTKRAVIGGFGAVKVVGDVWRHLWEKEQV